MGSGASCPSRLNINEIGMNQNAVDSNFFSSLARTSSIAPLSYNEIGIISVLFAIPGPMPIDDRNRCSCSMAGGEYWDMPHQEKQVHDDALPGRAE